MRNRSRVSAISLRIVSANIALAFVLVGCAANPEVVTKTSGLVTDPFLTTTPGARVVFHHGSFYSLIAPKSNTSCAGDAKVFYQLNTPNTPFPLDASDSSVTSKPEFIRNISVDLTDASGKMPANISQACSVGTAGPVPPTSSCATFDYGAINGVSSTLAGSLLIVGGIQGENYSGLSTLGTSPSSISLTCGSDGFGASPTTVNSCAPAFYALGVDSLDASSSITLSGLPNPLTPGLLGSAAQAGPISSWSNLGASGSTSAGVPGTAGATLGLSIDLAKLVLFGGTQPLSAFDGDSPGADSADVWTFNLATQSWTKQTQKIYVADDIQYMADYTTVPAPAHYVYFKREVQGRSLFQMLSVPGMGISSVSNGLLKPNATDITNLSSIDTTDRILFIGGYDDTGAVSPHTMKFNPTFGPELVDRLGTTATGTAAQYAESYYIQMMSDYATWTYLGVNPATEAFINFGGVPLINRITGFLGPSASGPTMKSALGSALVGGGFNNAFPNTRTIAPSPSPSPVGFRNLVRFEAGLNGLTTPGQRSLAQVTAMADDPGGKAIFPIAWRSDLPAPPVVSGPYGGVTMLPGFNLDNNDVVYFGGSTCRDFLGDATLQSPPCDFSNPGSYVVYQNGTPFQGVITPDPINPIGQIPWSVGAPPQAAGMAAARGLDEKGNVIMLAWGGMTAQVTAADAKTISILYNASTVTTPSPAWRTITTSAPYPNTLTNAAMVFSHVTRKFYVFGGISLSSGTHTLGDTWELTIQGDCKSGAPACTGFWRKLIPASQGGQMTCYPSCPDVRRSHRMVETNYAYRLGMSTGAGEFNVYAESHSTHPLEPKCTNPAAPCSFGIFMQGGTSDGFSMLSDRWLFDPTANNGNGHWQAADHLPARHFGQSATVDYYISNSSRRYHRMVTFGGEMGLQNPSQVRTDDFVDGSTFAPGTQNFFVSPTLADTWIFDLESNDWHRVKLLGQGWNLAAMPPASPQSFDSIQSYLADTTNTYFKELSVLSPPPTAGGIMVTRTQASPVPASGIAQATLEIPEVYMIGGRNKDGTYRSIDEVYKFCIGSAGENSTGHCETNFSTSDYVGRWLQKTPTVAAGYPTVGSSRPAPYLGAGVYDSVRDRIVIAGGLISDSAVTNSNSRAIMGMSGGNVSVFEYTPNYDRTAGLTGGAWTEVGSCVPNATSPVPTGRYGHTLSYDPSHQQLLMVGGYNINGVPIYINQNYPVTTGRTYTMPEVWTAKYYAASATPYDVNIDALAVSFTSTGDGCYLWQKKTIFGNSIDVTAQQPPFTGIGHAAGVMIPPTGYATGFYSLFDNACKGANPVLSADPELSRENAGGVYMDIDRSQLGPHENLLLTVTFIPLGSNNVRPDGAQLTNKESAVLEVHLVKTGQSLDTLQSAQQPRYIRYADDESLFPHVVERLSVLSPPTGEVRQEQLLIPLSIDPGIDRIRVQRRSGSAILIDASLTRMGYK